MQFVGWIRGIRPEYVCFGFKSKPGSMCLPEPTGDKVQKLARRLTDSGIEVCGKTLRGVVLPNVG
ncbi:MAG: hypothetical protein GX575_32315 [Candidatus Anammoximicrobium sp.]|nr:hypothetical protein [Candidatus Anammoximicrobium sp.]